MTIETFDPYPGSDTFADGLLRIERLGSCRRLVFFVSEPHACGGPSRAIVAKLIVPAELMRDLAQMIAADAIDPATAFPSTPSRIEVRDHERNQSGLLKRSITD